MVGIAALTLILFTPASLERPVAIPESTHLPTAQASAFLLNDRRVQRELDATEDQSSQWNALYQTYFDRQVQAVELWQAQHRDSDAIDDSYLAPIEKDFAVQALDRLDAGQSQRLLQLGRQVLGPKALAAKAGAAEFGLSAHQQAVIATLANRIEELREEAAEELGQRADQLIPPSKDDFEAQRAYREALRQLASHTEELQAKNRLRIRDVEGQILNQLTPQQRAKWADWIGPNSDLFDREKW